VETMATAAGFQLREQCVDKEWGFAENLLTCAEGTYGGAG